MISISGKTLFITGGSRGIGLAIAQAMHAEGAEIVLSGFGEADVIARLKRLWTGTGQPSDELGTLLAIDALEALDPFDRVQLAFVVETCRSSRSLSDAGRKLFAASRAKRASTFAGIMPWTRCVPDRLSSLRLTLFNHRALEATSKTR